jgi:hypothetical protein
MTPEPIEAAAAQVHAVTVSLTYAQAMWAFFLAWLLWFVWYCVYEFCRANWRDPE